MEFEILTLNKSACAQILSENILPFWQEKMIDKRQGGFFGRIDGKNKLHKQADKGVILNARILWTFSSVYLFSKDVTHFSLAQRAYQYIMQYFTDDEFGGVYWMLDAEGNVVDSKKQIYAQAFVIYALSEYYKIKQDKAVLNLVIDLFHLVEKYSFDRENNGYLEAFDREWRLLGDLRLSDKDANEAKSMNTHLHVLEAYTNLYRIWPNEVLCKQLKNLIRLFLKKFIDSSGHFRLFFDEKWNLKSNKYSFGHDIEGGWLLYEAADVLRDKRLIESTSIASVRMTDAALEGMDKDGGLMNEGNKKGIEDSDKHWWPQAEALVGLVNAWQLTSDYEYLQSAKKVWKFIQTNIIDHRNGEWHWRTNKTGDVNTREDKAGPWKCPYHNGRAMLELMRRLPR